MRISIHTVLVLVLLGCGAWTVFASFGTESLVVSSVVTCGIFGVAFLLLTLAFQNRLPFLKTYILFTTFWYLIRIPQLVSDPGRFQYWEHYTLTEEQLLIGLTTFLWTYALVGFGLYGLESYLRLHLRSTIPIPASRLLPPVIAHFVLSAAIVLFLYNKMASSTFTKGITAVVGLDFLSRYFPIILVLQYRALGIWHKFAGLLLVAGSVLVGTLTGSKGVLFSLAVPAALCFFSPRFADRIKITPIRVVVAVLVVPAAVYLYHLGSVLRILQTYHVGGESVSILSLPRYVRDYPIEWDKTLDDISTRVTYLDSFLLVVSLDEHRLNNSVNLVNAGKSLVNMVIPVKVFPNVRRIGQMFRMDYYAGEDIGGIDETYHTDVFANFGVSVAMTNRFVGAIISLAFVAIELLFISFVLTRVPPRYYMYAFVLCMHSFYSCLYMMGPDDFVFYDIVVVFVQLAVHYCILATWLRLRLAGRPSSPAWRQPHAFGHG